MKNQCMAKQDGQNGNQDNITDIVLITLRVHRHCMNCTVHEIILLH